MASRLQPAASLDATQRSIARAACSQSDLCGSAARTELTAVPKSRLPQLPSAAHPARRHVQSSARCVCGGNTLAGVEQRTLRPDIGGAEAAPQCRRRPLLFEEARHLKLPEQLAILHVVRFGTKRLYTDDATGVDCRPIRTATSRSTRYVVEQRTLRAWCVELASGRRRSSGTWSYEHCNTLRGPSICLFICPALPQLRYFHARLRSLRLPRERLCRRESVHKRLHRPRSHTR